MYTLGVDIGAATTKAVVLNSGHILSHSKIPTGHKVKIAIDEVVNLALERGDVKLDDMAYIVSTGYGRNSVDFANRTITEILCHGRGVNFLFPEARTIIDIGGQDSKAISIDEKGDVANFAMNDKCAAGTGRFLEVMAGVLGITVEEIGPLSLTSNDPCQISTTCTIFAETEMVSLRAEGREREDLLAGIVRAVAARVAVMATNVGIKKEVIFTGGVANNIGVKKALEEKLGTEILVPEKPSLAGALGAAILGHEAVNR